MPDRPAIPAAVAREVRQRCGFSCILCGGLIVEYEHIIPYAENPEHKAENIVLLCPKHHTEVTSGRMDKRKIIEAARLPYAIKNGYNFGFYDFEPHGGLKVFVSSTFFDFQSNSGNVDVVTIFDKTLFSILYDEGFPQFSFEIYDISGELAIKVERNELRMCKRLWDIRLAGKYLRVFYKKDIEIAKIKIDKSRIIFEKLAIYFKNSMVIMRQDNIEVCDNQIENFKITFSKFTVPQGYTLKYIGINCEKSGFAHRFYTNNEPITESDYINHLKKVVKIPKDVDYLDENVGYGPYGYETRGRS